MARSQREAQVGLVVILSGIILIVGMLWFKQFRFAGGTNVYAVDFPSVDALQVRDRVQVRGIRMGAVEGLAIVEDFVRVTIRLDQKADLRQDAQFRLGTIGIVGEKVIEINPGRGGPVPEGHVFKGEAELSMSSMGSAAGDALQEVRELAAQMRSLLHDLREEGQPVATLSAARQAADGMSGLLQENRASLRDLIADIKATSSALRTALAGPDSSLAGMASGASRSFARADSVMGQLQHAAASLMDIMDRLQAGEGSAGRLLADESLYARAESTLASIEELVDDVRRNPRRYFKFSVIDF
jgi:phospholipid/cholesterol/gamma-HCH transport system substrate-binding protein